MRAWFWTCPCLPCAYSWHHTCDKMYQALNLLLSGKSLGTRPWGHYKMIIRRAYLWNNWRMSENSKLVISVGITSHYKVCIALNIYACTHVVYSTLCYVTLCYHGIYNTVWFDVNDWIFQETECSDEKNSYGGSWYLSKLYSPPTNFFTSTFFDLV